MNPFAGLDYLPSNDFNEVKRNTSIVIKDFSSKYILKYFDHYKLCRLNKINNFNHYFHLMMYLTAPSESKRLVIVSEDKQHTKINIKNLLSKLSYNPTYQKFYGKDEKEDKSKQRPNSEEDIEETHLTEKERKRLDYFKNKTLIDWEGQDDEFEDEFFARNMVIPIVASSFVEEKRYFGDYYSSSSKIRAATYFNSNTSVAVSVMKNIKVFSNYDSTASSFTLKGHSQNVCAIIDMGVNLIASTAKDKTVKLWDTANQIELKSFHLDDTNNTYAAGLIRENSSLLMTALNTEQIYFWDIASKTSSKVNTYKKMNFEITWVEQGRRRIYILYLNGLISVYQKSWLGLEPETEKLRDNEKIEINTYESFVDFTYNHFFVIKNEHNGKISGLKELNNESFVTVCRDGKIRYWKHTTKLLEIHAFKKIIFDPLVFEEMNILVTAGLKAIKLWNLTKMTKIYLLNTSSLKLKKPISLIKAV